MNRFDSSLLKLLTHDNVLGYLGTNGWSKRSSQDYSSVWVKNGYEVLIPSAEARDFRPRIHEALKEISAEKDISVEAAFRQMLMGGFETIKISTIGPSFVSGTVSFEAGTKLIANIRDLLVASASAVIDPRRVYVGKRADLAETFLREARLGQTEHGSFVVTILTPVMKPDGDLLPGMEAPLPYGTKVIETLLGATKKATLAAEASVNDADWFEKRFVPLVANGVSANLCSGISGLLSVEAADHVEISVRSSSSYRFETGEVRIPATYSDRFALAAAEFRKDPPLDNIDVKGKTISLRRDGVTKTGKVSLKGEVGGELRRITFSLSPNDYNLVLEAHKHDHPISFTADLRKNARSYEAVNIRNLKSLSSVGLFSRDQT